MVHIKTSFSTEHVGRNFFIEILLPNLLGFATKNIFVLGACVLVGCMYSIDIAETIEIF
jgi:hypothetical protein